MALYKRNAFIDNMFKEIWTVLLWWFVVVNQTTMLTNQTAANEVSVCPFSFKIIRAWLSITTPRL
jgi:hypothetical protein